MSEFKAKLQKLKEQRKQISQSNFKEVLEENERSKRPVNWEKKLERNLKKIESEEEKQKAEELGQDYELKKSLNIQANQFDKWDKIQSSKKKQDPGFIDYESATRRQYNRLTKQLTPNLDEPTSSTHLDSKEGVERMVEDVHKQIEVRNKRSRRRAFDDEADVDYINERNMRFNKKLERFYGEYTGEIKQNFERGTAL